MPRSYSHQELLKLRESPLVCKPASLPPVEEWMGPMPDQTQVQNQNQRRTANNRKSDEASTTESTSSRRPVFEGKTRSTNVPEDIVLGPPKTAFASASGARNRTQTFDGVQTFDSQQRPSFSNHEDSSAKTDRTNFRDRHPKESQRDSEQTRDLRSGPNQNRRSVKDDSDLWSSVRQPRPSGLDDTERQHRRNGVSKNLESRRREGDRDSEVENGERRTGLGRGRNEPSWYREEARNDEGGTEEQEATKPRDWREKERRGTRGAERAWTRGAKADLDPEWMDAPEPEDKNRIHTQEDFEKWKERMRSGNSMKVETPVEQRASHDRTASATSTTTIKAKTDTPLVVDSTVDGFFGLWDDPKKREKTSESMNGAHPVVANPGAKVSKSSKFTGFFNPKPDTEPPKEKQPLPLFAPPADSSNEDKEGFQRILSLLGQQQQQQQNPANGRPGAPAIAQQQQNYPVSPPAQASKGAENHDLYSLLGARSPAANAPPQTRDSEFLLKLMQQQQPQNVRPDLSKEYLDGRRASQATTAALSNFSNLFISPHDTSQHTSTTQPPPGFIDDVQPRDKLNPGAERKGPPPGFFDGNSTRPSPAGLQQSGFPSGLQRPPGLDQTPPGYPQHVQQQRQNMVPPPGFQTASRGLPGFPPGLISNDRLQFGMPANGRSMPPPGFMHPTQPTPPGFPVPFGQDGMPYGTFGDGGHYGHIFPPGQQRR